MTDDTGRNQKKDFKEIKTEVATKQKSLSEDATQTVKAAIEQEKEVLTRNFGELENKVSQQLKQSEKDAERALSRRAQAWMDGFNERYPYLVRWQHLVLLALINGLIYLSFSGSITSMIQMMGGDYIHSVNSAYLQKSAEESGLFLVIVGEIKMVLSVLQSSQGGINFFIDVEVQLGQALKPLVDAIQTVWHFSMLSIAAITALELSLGVSSLLMTPSLTAMFVFMGLYCALGKRLPALKVFIFKCGKTLFVVMFVMHIMIPSAVFTTALLSHSLLAQQHSEVRGTVSNFHSKLSQSDTKQGLKKQVSHSIAHFKDKQHQIRNEHRPMAVSAAKHATLVLIEFILAPLLIFYLGFRLVLRALRQWQIHN